ncbi:MAG: hypothetical protein HY684_06100 [Chloroflexi bacterium]|nr:hypothetical protein [Chloroflexota bacterium]
MNLRVSWIKRTALASATAALLLVATVGGASAASKTVLLKANLHLVSGENPSAPAGIPADGSAKLLLLEDGTTLVKISLDNMDPARFPPGEICQAEAKAGSFSAKGLDLDLKETGTSVDYRTPGAVIAGDKAEVRVRCEFNGQRHETRWGGIFQPVSD